jgi:small subunit ribosomal protein S14
MAKISSIAKNRRRVRIVAQYAERRAALLLVLKSNAASASAKVAARKKFDAMPRDASATRIKNRCEITGRARGYLRKFLMSRIAFREAVLRGDIPGVVKASW